MVAGRPPIQELPRDEVRALTAHEQPGALPVCRMAPDLAELAKYFGELERIEAIS